MTNSFQRHIEAARRLRDLNSEQGVQAALTCAEHAAATDDDREQLHAERADAQRWLASRTIIQTRTGD